MTIKPTSQRHVTTLLYLLRGYAEQQRRMHGPGVERPGGIELTPLEMEAWADDIEAQALPDNSALIAELRAAGGPAARQLADKLEAEHALPSNSEEGWLDT